MSCDHLICARCSHPVAEGRCATCRAARDELHGHGPVLSPAVILAGLILLLACAMLLQHAYG
jgi:hypothetical protein